MPKTQNSDIEERKFLTPTQKNSLLEWLAQGLEPREMRNLALQHRYPFKLTPKAIKYWRYKFKGEIISLRREKEKEALRRGLALRSNRLQALYDLAVLLERDLKFEGKLWLNKVKGIGSGSYFERVVEQEFNEAELRQLRGIYEDIAKEVGARKAELGIDQEEENVPRLLSLPADTISAPFVDVFRDVKNQEHLEYVLKGGRGSTKSSFTSLVMVYLLIRNPEIHGIALRQVANTLRDSVYTQLVWAINMLGLAEEFKCITSPLEITYIATGQKIYFRGADKPEKIKSIKPVFGHIGLLWFEELDQFFGQEAIRKIEQSVIRGGELAWEFKTYNPPRTAANWVNNYVLVPKPNQYQHHSTYLTVPRKWLGTQFLNEAEHLKKVNPLAYKHEYLGEITGTGGLVFENVVLREITEEEIKEFDRVMEGLDWGYFPDPFAWIKAHYESNLRKLFLFDEYKALKAGNKETYDYLVEHKGYTPDQMIIADSAEPKSIADYREYGASCRGALKGPESVNYSMKWLQSLTEIIIDPIRCPEAAQEFLNYELEMDKNGEYISHYPDKNNHFIDAVRYRTNLIWKRRGK